ncbi:MAG: hypothetical protein DRP82_03225 [Planctomycetota bacterium]|nr:MAG: hypothetical protein DRP82_03225 [Planctomycetota bacterium]
MTCPAPLIGEILLEAGLVTQDDIKEALKEQRETGALLGEILRRRGLVTSQQVWKAWVTQLARKYQVLGKLEAPTAVRRLAFGDLAEHYRAVPLMLEDVTVILIKTLSDMPIIEDLDVFYEAQKLVVATTSPRLLAHLRKAYPRAHPALCCRCSRPICHPLDRITIGEDNKPIFICRDCYDKLSKISGVFRKEETHQEEPS